MHVLYRIPRVLGTSQQVDSVNSEECEISEFTSVTPIENCPPIGNESVLAQESAWALKVFIMREEGSMLGACRIT